MATLNEMVFDIKNIAYGGETTSDAEISDEQVIYWINQYRSVLLKQMIDKRKSIPESFIQFLECIEMELIDMAECCSITSGCLILRSKKRLPKTIHTRGRNAIMSVDTVNKSVSFSETTYFRAKRNKNNKYTSRCPRWFIKDDYLYILNSALTEKVSSSLIPEDPREARNFNTCENTPCYSDDDQYPITSNMAKVITDLILKERIVPILGFPTDEKNDANEEEARKG